MNQNYDNIKTVISKWLVTKKGWTDTGGGVFRKTKKIFRSNTPEFDLVEYRIQLNVKDYGFLCDRKENDRWEFVKFVSYEHVSHDASGNILNITV